MVNAAGAMVNTVSTCVSNSVNKTVDKTVNTAAYAELTVGQRSAGEALKKGVR